MIYHLIIGLGAFIIWYFIGCVALALTDDTDGRIFNWAISSPLGTFGFILVVITWPYWMWRYYNG